MVYCLRAFANTDEGFVLVQRHCGLRFQRVLRLLNDVFKHLHVEQSLYEKGLGSPLDMAKVVLTVVVELLKRFASSVQQPCNELSSDRRIVVHVNRGEH